MPNTDPLHPNSKDGLQAVTSQNHSPPLPFRQSKGRTAEAWKDRSSLADHSTAILAQSPDCIFLIAPSGKILDFHPGIRGNPFGPVATVVGRMLPEILPWGTSPSFREIIVEALGGVYVHTQVQITRPHHPLNISLQFALVSEDKVAVTVSNVSTQERDRLSLEVAQLATSQQEGLELLESLACTLSTSLGLRAAWIGALTDENPSQLQEIAQARSGEQQPLESLAIAGTVFETVLQQDFVSHVGNLAEQFPEDPLLAQSTFRSFAGVPIISSSCKPLGLLCVFAEEESPAWLISQSLLATLATICGKEIERLHADEALSHQQVMPMHADRVATIGELSAGIIHDLSQPLYAIANLTAACQQRMLNVEFKATETEEGAKKEEILELHNRIMHATSSARRMVGQYRDFLGQQESHRSWIPLEQLLQGVLEMLAYEIRKHQVVIECEIAPGTKAYSHRIQLQQIFFNLILNACEAMVDTPATDRHIKICACESPIELEVSVTDHGTGIPPEISDRIYDPFFSTKQEGTGIGMAVVKSIVNQHGGRIWHSRPSHQGTSMHFTMNSVPSTKEA